MKLENIGLADELLSNRQKLKTAMTWAYNGNSIKLENEHGHCVYVPECPKINAALAEAIKKEIEKIDKEIETL